MGCRKKSSSRRCVCKFESGLVGVALALTTGNFAAMFSLFLCRSSMWYASLRSYSWLSSGPIMAYTHPFCLLWSVGLITGNTPGAGFTGLYRPSLYLRVVYLLRLLESQWPVVYWWRSLIATQPRQCFFGRRQASPYVYLPFGQTGCCIFWFRFQFPSHDVDSLSICRLGCAGATFCISGTHAVAFELLFAGGENRLVLLCACGA